MNTRFTSLFVLLICAVLASGCAASASATAVGPATSSLTEAQAVEIATQALSNGYNGNDSAAYLQDMDDTMKAAVTPEGFAEFIQPYKGTYGNFIAVESAELTHAKTPGFVRWTFTCQFEKGPLYFALVFPQDGDKAAGAVLSDQKP